MGKGQRRLQSLIACAAALLALLVPALAAAQTAPNAADAAAVAYRQGDYAAARDLWQQGCDAGRAKDCYHLGIMYRDGEGVAPDPARYTGLMTRACDGDIASACHNLGRGQLRSIEEGTGTATRQEIEAGIAFYRRGCTLGLNISCSNLGQHLAREAATGDKDALAALRQTCIDGAGAICFGLASLYDIHLEATLGDDPAAANEALLLGCERFDRDSCQNLA